MRGSGEFNISFQYSIAKDAEKTAIENAAAEAERVRNTLIDIQTKVFDRAAAYTSLILFGGYAGAFAIWNFTRDHLTEWAEIWAALLLIISLATFISFEVFKMIILSRRTFKQRALLTKSLPPDLFFKELQELDHHNDIKMTKLVIPIWIGSLSIAVSTALGAVGIFLWNFAVILIRSSGS